MIFSMTLLDSGRQKLFTDFDVENLGDQNPEINSVFDVFGKWLWNYNGWDDCRYSDADQDEWSHFASGSHRQYTKE